MRPLVIILFLSLFVYSCGSSRRTPPSPKPPVETTVSYRLYEVKQGETFSSIASKNAVTVQQLKNANQGIREPLKAGQKIKIPLDAKVPAEVNMPDTVKEPIRPKDLLPGFKDRYKVVMLLPFKSQMYDETGAEIEPMTKMVLEFYEGALIAFDSLETLGLKADVHVIDTDKDDKTISEFLNSKLAVDADIIIGPAYSSKVGMVEDFSKKNNKILISPISSSPDITKNNEFGFQFTPSVPTQIDLASRYIADNFNNVNAVIVHKDLIIDNDLKNMYKNSLKKYGVEDVYNVIFNSSGNVELKNKLIAGRKNFVIIASSNEAYVAEVFSDLVNYATDYDISVMGLPTWEAFETIDFAKLQNLETHFFSTSNINFENYNTRVVRKKFISRWKTDPSSLGYQGYDVAFIFGKALLENGLYFQEQLPKFIYQPTQNGLNWNKTAVDGGYENQYVTILRYKDFELRKVNK